MMRPFGSNCCPNFDLDRFHSKMRCRMGRFVFAFVARLIYKIIFKMFCMNVGFLFESSNFILTPLLKLTLHYLYILIGFCATFGRSCG